jgi:hypothetical protein
MKRSFGTVGLAALFIAACGGGQATSPVPQSGNPTPAASTPAAITQAPSSAPTGSDATATVLEGTWVTEPTTCEQQTAAARKAGFTDDDLQIAGFDPTTCFGAGSQFSIRFAGDRLLIFQDGEVGWDGTFRIVDDDTFGAGDTGDLYLTYEYALDGDTLTIDMIRDDYPTTSADELVGEQLAQTVIYETTPFHRQADGSTSSFTSSLYPYRLTLPGGWSAATAGGDVDGYQSPDGVLMLTVGSGQPEPGQTVADRVAANRASEFPGCQTDPATDRTIAIGGEEGILWSFICGDAFGLGANTIHAGTGYRLTVRAPATMEREAAEAMDAALASFVFTD